ncbi:hypothetical protein OIU76_013680 [Salix suchowensis]|nr:hypothetical protein OIU76_013680 [Salix suchowensis]
MSEGTNTVMGSSEDGTDISQDDKGTTEEAPEDTKLLRQSSVNLVPFIGQRFASQDAAYEFYCSYAKQCGFSIRRHRTRGKDGVGRGVTRRDFTCHRGGYPQMKQSEDGKMQRNRKSSRCGCQAFMRIVKRADFDVPEWRVTGFSNIHNHEMFKSNETHLHPASGTMSPDDKSRICIFAKAGINVNQDNDAIDLIAMCKKLKDEDHNFKYDLKLIATTVVFDTTHHLDAYDMWLGIWVGVDNHGMACFFSCVLLREENMESFSWALKAFMDFMNGKAPQTILSDQNMRLKEAIAIEIPDTKHAYCICHIISKFSDWFSTLLGSCYDDWKDEFLRLYNLESVQDFEEGWSEMVEKYELHANKHITSLYAFRSFWALSFLRNYFFGGTMDICQSGSITAFIQRFLSAQSRLDYFVEELADIVDYKPELPQKLHKVYLKTGSPIESHAASVLTPYAFGKFQEELVLAPQYASFPVDEYCFQVRHHTQINGGCRVIWDSCQGHISCSCSWFEYSGILCRHVLRVLSTNNCFQIPDDHLPTRWQYVSSSSRSRMHSEKIQLLESMASTLMAESVETKERLDVACEQISMVLSHLRDLPTQTHGENAYSCPSDSLILQEVVDSGGIVNFTIENPDDPVTLAKLKERQPRVGVDISRKRRHHSGPCCGHFRHDASDCSMMRSDQMDATALGYL